MAYHKKLNKKNINDSQIYSDKNAPEYKLCKSCIYRSRPENLWNCDYITFVGHSRGCDPGNKCTKYKKGQRLKINKNIF